MTLNSGLLFLDNPVVFEICGHKMHGMAMETSGVGVILMFTPKYEIDRTTQYWVPVYNSFYYRTSRDKTCSYQAKSSWPTYN